MELLLFYLSLAIIVSFFCSILEAVLLSMSSSYIAVLSESGSPAGKLLERLKLDVDRPLAAILSLNTIAHTVGATGVGAQAQLVFAHVPFSIISGVLTFLILVLSEIIPKTIGATYWRLLAVPSAYLIHFLTVIMAPLVTLSAVLSGLLTRGKKDPAISRDEIHAAAALGEQEGVIDSTDAKLLRSMMSFQSVIAHDVFTPRPVVKSFNAQHTIRQMLASAEDLTFSRYPVLGERESILGYVLRSDLLNAAARDEWERTAAEFTKEAIIIPENLPLKGAFGLFLRQRAHLAMVVDEFGGFTGVLSLEDVIESLIGHEIMDEGDNVADLREFARQSNSRKKTLLDSDSNQSSSSERLQPRNGNEGP